MRTHSHAHVARAELYHSTPETQTDEAYSHPEDEEHFANHEHIEAEEERRERAFQGLSPEDDLRAAPHDRKLVRAAFAEAFVSLRSQMLNLSSLRAAKPSLNPLTRRHQGHTMLRHRLTVVRIRTKTRSSLKRARTRTNNKGKADSRSSVSGPRSRDRTHQRSATQRSVLRMTTKVRKARRSGVKVMRASRGPRPRQIRCGQCFSSRLQTRFTFADPLLDSRNVPYKVKSPLSRQEKLLTGSCPAAQKYKVRSFSAATLVIKLADKLYTVQAELGRSVPRRFASCWCRTDHVADF